MTSGSAPSEEDDTLFLAMTLSIQLCLIGAYFTFFLLIFRSTKGARTFEDLILHKEVPELVYLQTRKLLRDEHYKRAEGRRTAIEANSDGEDDDGADSERVLRTARVMDGGFSSKVRRSVQPTKSVSFNPNLQSQRSNSQGVFDG